MHWRNFKLKGKSFVGNSSKSWVAIETKWKNSSLSFLGFSQWLNRICWITTLSVCEDETREDRVYLSRNFPKWKLILVEETEEHQQQRVKVYHAKTVLREWLQGMSAEPPISVMTRQIAKRILLPVSVKVRKQLFLPMFILPTPKPIDASMSNWDQLGSSSPKKLEW